MFDLLISGGAEETGNTPVGRWSEQCFISMNRRHIPKEDMNQSHTHPLPQLSLFPLLHRGQVVDGRILDDGQEDKDKADPQVDVHRLDVGDPGHGGVDPRDDGGHGEHRGDTWGQNPHMVSTVVIPGDRTPTW